MMLYLIKNPIVLISFIVILIFAIFPPKSINSWYGYRTVRSMKNKEQWSFAQKYSAKLGLIIISIVLIIQCVLYLIYGSTSVTDLTTVGLWLIGMVILIFSVENKLKKREV